MEFTQIIYSTYLTKKGRDKIKEKMQKNEKFKVTSQNIEEFVEDMNFITNILKENHIEYKIKVEDEWLNSDAVITRYNYRTRIDIYLKKIDYEKIKPMIKEDDSNYYCENVEEEERLNTNSFNKIYNIVMSGMLIFIGTPLIALGIFYITKEEYSGLAIIIIGLLFFIKSIKCIIKKLQKVINGNNRKRKKSLVKKHIK